ncbi:MAG: glycosyltransferase [Spirochaetales bacterium]|nr:glycosyltransferase [Spirochaetales bacterium]
MKVSIIIPALNEENELPGLLNSILSQDFDDYEIIVADAHSTDRTRDIAREAGCRVVDGGMPAAGRNAGARAARGDFLFFLDADVLLPPGFIKDVYEEMEERYIDLATCAIKPVSSYQLDRIIHKLINLTILINLRIDPKAFGFCIFVTRRLFNRIGGFDETIKVAEDNDFVKRGAEYRSLRYLNSTHILVSVRRFEKEGRFAYMGKGIRLNLYRAFKGEIRNEGIVEYEFDAFDKPVKDEDRKFLDKFEKRLLSLEDHYKAFNQKARRRGHDENLQGARKNIQNFSREVRELHSYFRSKRSGE